VKLAGRVGGAGARARTSHLPPSQGGSVELGLNRQHVARCGPAVCEQGQPKKRESIGFGWAPAPHHRPPNSGLGTGRVCGRAMRENSRRPHESTARNPQGGLASGGARRSRSCEEGMSGSTRPSSGAAAAPSRGTEPLDHRNGGRRTGCAANGAAQNASRVRTRDQPSRAHNPTWAAAFQRTTRRPSRPILAEMFMGRRHVHEIKFLSFFF